MPRRELNERTTAAAVYISNHIGDWTATHFPFADTVDNRTELMVLSSFSPLFLPCSRVCIAANRVYRRYGNCFLEQMQTPIQIHINNNYKKAIEGNDFFISFFLGGKHAENQKFGN